MSGAVAGNGKKRERNRPAALLVVHGMGQQVPFQTLDQVYRGLRREEERAKGKGPKEIALHPTPQQVATPEGKVRYLDVMLVDKKDRIQPVHIYEGYWAPITEGKVTLRDVLGFLASGGWNGLTNAGSHHKRWVFKQNRPLPRGTALRGILVALFVLVGLAIIDLAVAASAAALLGQQDWPSAGLRSDLTWIAAALVVAPALLLGLCLWLGGFGRSAWRRKLWKHKEEDGAPRPKTDAWPWNSFVDTLGWTAFALACLGIMLAPVALAGAAFLRWRGQDFLASEGVPAAPEWAVYVLVFALLGISLVVRKTLVQSLGDVAAYVQTHKLDRFDEIREEIKKAVRKVAHALYDQKGRDGKPLYGRVAIVGHSLGSVVAYNTLNDLLNDDELAAPKDRRDILGRTKLLLTFGSPLDKLAFIFGTQSRRTSYARESLAARVQPLIFDPKFRTAFDWVNIWSPRDIISGALDLYDADPKMAPPMPPNYRPVYNHEDKHARVPLLAHNEYWANPHIWWEVRRTLVEGVDQRAPVMAAPTKAATLAPAPGTIVATPK